MVWQWILLGAALVVIWTYLVGFWFYSLGGRDAYRDVLEMRKRANK